MLHYILQIVAFQVVFLFIYDVFLKRETFFNYNRIYLLTTAVISFFIPFIKLETIKAVTPKDFVIVLPELIIGSQNIPTSLDRQVALQAGIVMEEPSMPIWQIVLMLGIVAAALLFTYKLIKLYWLRYRSPKRWNGNILLVKLLRTNVAFSFFNTIFLGEKIPETQKPSILKHELVHVKQWHSLDLLFFEIIRIFMWFNPLVYMYQNRIKALHEFVADETAVKQNGKKAYYQELLNQVFETNNLSFTNTFFKKSLIKKRIIMLQKSKSKQRALFKYILLVPAVFGMLFYVSCGKKSYNNDLVSKENLDKYSYQLSSKDGVVAPEIIKKKNAYETFLTSNKDYVGWGEYSADWNKTSYSVHHKNEKIPEGFSEGTITVPNGESYLIYYNKSPFETIQGDATTDIKTEEKELIPNENDDKSEVPFATIDNVPTYSDCKDLPSNEERKKCTSNKIAKFVSKNFNTDLAIQLGLEGRQRISVGFKINKEGFVTNIFSRAPHPELENEAERVISMLPKFIPGTQKGKPVTVPYALPIVFQVQNNSISEKKESQVYNKSYKQQSKEGMGYSQVDKAPVSKECEELKSEEEKKKCTSLEVAKFVNKNFNTDLALKLGLEGRQRISVSFEIDETGNVTNIYARAPHPELEKEAKRVIGMLPRFIPGMNEGKPVSVNYALPIVFQIAAEKKD